MIRELRPLDNRKSFYGKAYSETRPDGTEVLYSYNRPVMKKTPSGDLVRLWDDWSATTARHVSSFLGSHLPKALYLEIPLGTL